MSHTIDIRTHIEELLVVDFSKGKVYWKNTNRRMVSGAEAGTLDKSCGYWRVRLNGRTYLRSNIIALAYWPHYSKAVYKVIHKNNDTLDDRIDNLYLGTQSRANIGRRKIRHSSSSIKGVHFCNTSKKWIVQDRINRGSGSCYGRFDDKVSAEELARGLWVDEAKNGIQQPYAYSHKTLRAKMLTTMEYSCCISGSSKDIVIHHLEGYMNEKTYYDINNVVFITELLHKSYHKQHKVPTIKSFNRWKQTITIP